MKKSKRSIAIIIMSVMIINVNVYSQWTHTGNTTYLTNGLDKVGIGTNAPSYNLDIKNDSNCSFRVQSKVNGNANMILSRPVNTSSCLVNYKTGATNLWLTGCSNGDDFRIRNASGVDNFVISQASGFVGIGTSTPTKKLDVVGGDAIVNGLTIGRGGGSSSYNTALGLSALDLCTTGKYNTAIGAFTLSQNTTGNDNSALGWQALQVNTTGIANVAVGVYALNYNNSGRYNTALGTMALYFNSSGNSNTAIGYFALKHSTGNSNTAIGDSALYTNTTGSLNTAIGYKAQVGSGTLTNATAIGANAIVSASNSLVLGNGVNVGIGTSTPSAKLDVAGKIKIVDGTQASGKVLTSDVNGLASWQTFSGSSQWTTSGANIYYNNGNVGIGTSAPSAKLHVYGDIKQEGTGISFYETGSPTLRAHSITHIHSLGSDANNALMFNVSNGAGVTNQRMIINGVGNVGIGTSSPNYPLDVRSNASNTAIRMIYPSGGPYFSSIAFSDPTQGASNISARFDMGFESLTGNSNSYLAFRTGQSPYAGNADISVERMRITSAGKVGIGTSTPNAKLEVAVNTGDAYQGVALTNTSAGGKTLTINQGLAGKLNFTYPGVIDLVTMDFNNNRVGIGTTTPATGYLLSVNGKIICEEVRVALHANWPDYVFEKSHKLIPLADLQSKIENEKHLPGMPSASEVKQNGISIGEMQSKLLEKIEELTLYVLQQQKQIDELKAKQNSLVEKGGK